MWEHRLREMSREAGRRRAARATLREGFARRREHGLVERNAIRRARQAARAPAAGRPSATAGRQYPASGQGSTAGGSLGCGSRERGGPSG